MTCSCKLTGWDISGKSQLHMLHNKINVAISAKPSMLMYVTQADVNS